MTTEALHFAKVQSAAALGRAMETRAAFSWITTRDVQCGVYLKYTQGFFAQYRAL